MPINSQFLRNAEPPNPATLSPAVASLFPRGVIAAELRIPGDASLLHPEEAPIVAKAVPKRVHEFAAGRLCARRALAEIGIEGFALKAAPDRTPIWPGNVAGSITHTLGFCAAVIAERSRFAALGLDAEVRDDVKPDLWPHICVPEELAWIASLPPGAQATAATLVFSAKEAFYKCQYPLTGEPLSFADVCVKVSGRTAEQWGEIGRGGGMSAGLVAVPTRRVKLSSGDNPEFRGTYRIEDGYVSAAFWLTDPGTVQ